MATSLQTNERTIWHQVWTGDNSQGVTFIKGQSLIPDGKFQTMTDRLLSHR